MVAPSYMLARPAAPTALKRFVDQDAFPWAINVAGTIEGLLWRASVFARRRPGVMLLAAFSIGAFAGAAHRGRTARR